MAEAMMLASMTCPYTFAIADAIADVPLQARAFRPPTGLLSAFGGLIFP
jgi:hypothetical protein